MILQQDPGRIHLLYLLPAVDRRKVGSFQYTFQFMCYFLPQEIPSSVNPFIGIKIIEIVKQVIP